MIDNYSHPQSLIRQVFIETPDRESDRINTFIAGPAYQLARYTTEAERELMAGEAFALAGVEVPYEGKLPGAVVDADYTKLFGEDLKAKLATISADFTLNALTTPNKIVIGTDGVVNNGNTTLNAAFVGRDVQVGDQVVITDPLAGTSGTRTRYVTAIEKSLEPSTFGSNNDSDDTLPAASSTNPVTSVDTFTQVLAPVGWVISPTATDFNDTINGPTYAGYYGDLFTITVTEGTTAATAKFSVRSNSGFYSADGLVATVLGDDFTITDQSIFQGVAVTLEGPAANGDNLEVGYTWQFSVRGDYTPLTLGTHIDINGTYTGKSDTKYFVRVTEGSDHTTGSFTGAKVRIYDSNGVDQTLYDIEITSGVATNLGSLGLTVTFTDGVMPPQDGLKAGDVYTVKAVASKATGPATIVVLNGSAIDVSTLVDNSYVINEVEFYKVFSGELERKRDIGPVYSWTSNPNSLTVEANLSLFVEGRDPGSEWVAFEDGFGKLFAHYRAIRPASATGAIIKIEQDSDIVEAFGVIDMDNTLAFAASTALKGSQGKPIFAGQVNTNDAAGYTKLFNEASNRDDLYAFAVMTYDSEVVTALQNHVNAMSQPDKQKWRRGYFATKSSSTFSKLTLTSNETLLNATVVDDGSGAFIKVITEDTDFVEADIKAGDKFRTNYSVDAFGDAVYEEYTIAVVLSNEELLLESGPSVEIDNPVKFEVWAADTGYNQATRVGQISAQKSDRRLINVWVDSPEVLVTDAGGNSTWGSIEVYYVAAEIAGLRSAVLVQQGLTRTEIASIGRATAMYTKYTEAELNIAAAQGTFIVTQNLQGGEIFIRHQLTTETEEGSLAYEDSVGVNADEISYATKDFIKGYIGKRNATPETVAALRIGYENLLLERTKAPTFSNLGPQILEIIPGSIKVAIDKIAKDTINMESVTALPLPLNRIEVTQTHRATLA